VKEARLWWATELPYAIKKAWFTKKIHVKYGCPHCTERLTSPLLEAGEPERCPVCGFAFWVPGLTDQREYKLAEAKRLDQRIQDSMDENKYLERESLEPMRLTDPRRVLVLLGNGVLGWCVLVISLPLTIPLFLSHLLVEAVFEIIRDLVVDLADGEDSLILNVVGGLGCCAVIGLPLFFICMVASSYLGTALVGMGLPGLLVLWLILNLFSKK
jgi:DNA-directed RNA polymerase subunit RPC12/RpoP